MMRVGALTPQVQAPAFYAFTWSTIGVATEYVEPATVIRDFRKTVVPSLSELRPIVVGGVLYEEDFTSGGAADLPTSLAGKVRTLDYKTLRHPGHYGWVQSVLAEAPPGSDRAGFLHERMQQTVPSADEDQVVIYAAVERKGGDGFVRRIEEAEAHLPLQSGAPLSQGDPVDNLRGARRVGPHAADPGLPRRLPAEPDRSQSVHGRTVRQPHLRLTAPAVS